jgi:N6-adenosine-specific RNA methylase IME4
VSEPATALVIPDQYTRTGLTLPDDLDFDTWADLGQRIQMAADASMWWLGDWWAYGEHRYGERAAAVLDGDYAFQTFMDAGWVSKKIETSRRREVLSWSHHKEVAALDAEDQDDVLRAAIDNGWTVRETRKAARDVKARKSVAAALPADTFRVIYADPPWQYNDRRNLEGYDNTAAESHYPTMSVEQLSALDVRSLATPDCVLFCWATFPLLPDALSVIAAWGFEYKTAFVWAKGRANLGNYHDASAELLIVAVRGSCTPDERTRAKQVIDVKAEGRHSEKPEHFRIMIDTLYNTGPRIELFRRGDAPDGWSVWGNEADYA